MPGEVTDRFAERRTHAEIQRTLISAWGRPGTLSYIHTRIQTYVHTYMHTCIRVRDLLILVYLTGVTGRVVYSSSFY